MPLDFRFFVRDRHAPRYMLGLDDLVDLHFASAYLAFRDVELLLRTEHSRFIGLAEIAATAGDESGIVEVLARIEVFVRSGRCAEGGEQTPLEVSRQALMTIGRQRCQPRHDRGVEDD